jgi:leucine dehydrogenase
MTITHAPATPAAEVSAALPTEAPEHERVLITRGPRSGLTIIVAVHSTRLGQALGGAAPLAYGTGPTRSPTPAPLAGHDAEERRRGPRARRRQVRHLHPLGVTLDEPTTIAAMLDLGDAVESLGGAYMTAEDVGTSAELMAVVAERTAHVCGLPPEQGGVGEPADATAAASTLDPRDPGTCRLERREGRHFVVAGSRRSGAASRAASPPRAPGSRDGCRGLEAHLAANSGHLGGPEERTSSRRRVRALRLGGVLTHEVVDALRVRAVVRRGQQQLASRDVAVRLTERRIVWAPDFVANAAA